MIADVSRVSSILGAIVSSFLKILFMPITMRARLSISIVKIIKMINNDLIIADISLHYFSNEDTKKIINEIKRVFNI